MKHGNWGWTALLGLLVAPALAANKCIDADGRISYQAAPCPANTRGGDMSLNVNRSVSGQANPPSTAGVTTAPGNEASPTSKPSPNGQDRGARSGQDSNR